MIAATVGEIEGRLVEYLAGKLPEATSIRLEGLIRPSVGWSHEIWLFDAVWEQDGDVRSRGLCLRIDRGNTLLREHSSLAEQYRVLECLDATPVPTPTPFALEEDPGIIGAPFLIMDKAAGVCPSPWSREGKAFYAEAAARGGLPHSFTQTLAELHNLDWRAAGLDFLGVPGPGPDFACREVAKWRTLIESSGLEMDPVLVDLICTLEKDPPHTDRHVLVHGAYRTGNLMIAEDRVSAVLDWELQVIGDPMYDVAYVLSELNKEGSDLLSLVVDKHQFIEEYQELTGLTVDEEICHYYQLLYDMRVIAFWMSASGLFFSGQSSDLRLARTAWSIPVVLGQAARDLGY